MRQTTRPRYISVGAVDAAQPVKLHLGQIGNVDVGFAGKNAGREGEQLRLRQPPKEMVSF